MRRASVYLLSTIVLPTIVLVGGGAFTTAQDTDFADHPIVGSWMMDFAAEDPDNAPVLAVFSADGTYIEIDTDRRGTWEPTGDTTAELFISQVQEEDTMMFHARIEVDPDGQSLTATYTVEVFTPSDDADRSDAEFTIGYGVAEGTRMEATPEGFATPAATPRRSTISTRTRQRPGHTLRAVVRLGPSR